MDLYFFENEQDETNSLKKEVQKSLIEIIEINGEVRMKDLLDIFKSNTSRNMLAEILQGLEKNNTVEVIQKSKNLGESRGLSWDTYIVLKSKTSD